MDKDSTREERNPGDDGNRNPRKIQLKRDNNSEGNENRRSYNSDRGNRSYGDQGNRSYNNDRGGSRSYNSDRGSRPYNNDRGGNSYNSDRAGNRSYGDQGNRNYNSDRGNRSYGDQGNRSYNNDRGNRNYGDGNNRPAYGSPGRSSYGSRDNNQRGSYGNRENRPYNNSRYNSGQGNSYGNGERRNYSSNRPYQDYQKEDVRYDENNKKVVFRKRKTSSEGVTKKHFEAYREDIDMTKPVRLNKFLANAGVCSRREADDYIMAGVITVNGEVVNELGAKILPTDKVMFHDQPVQTERKVYLILNKPKDFVTTVEDTHDRKIVMDLVKNACGERIYPVGRLDRNTTGVLLFTNDGDLAAKLTHPKFEKKKIYQVSLDRDIEEKDFQAILEGVELDDGVIAADDLSFVEDGNRKKVGIEIHSGKNRIVRRLFDKLGYKVVHLDRVYFAGLTKKNLPRGRYRFLTGKEISTLKMGAYE